MHFDIYEITGLVGVFLALLAYLLLNMDRLQQKDLSFLLLNCVGAAMILVSLVKHWNVASFVIEIAWLFISLYGLLRVFVYAKDSKS
jgi:hypothetical protein